MAVLFILIIFIFWFIASKISKQNKKYNYTNDSLLKLEENKKFFMKFKEEIENNINEKERIINYVALSNSDFRSSKKWNQ